MSTHNICFYGELTKLISELSSNTLLICSTETKIKLFLKEFSDQGLHCLPGSTLFARVYTVCKGLHCLPGSTLFAWVYTVCQGLHCLP